MFTTLPLKPPPSCLCFPSFCLPYCSTPNPLSNPRHVAIATCTAIALTLSPIFPFPSRFTPPPSQHHPPRQYQNSPYLHANFQPPTAIALVQVQPSPSPPPVPSVPSVELEPEPLPPIKATALIDKDYSQAPLWQYDNRPARARLVLPPRPEMSAEVRILTRLLVALVVGGSIGMERRAANSLAGVRTFSLVSLGAAIFMTTTLVAFPDADPARVAAAISSSVGFLGAGAMSKNSRQSRGLTTASSVWLAAALGIAAACGMFLLSFIGAISTVLIARYARFDSSLQLIKGEPVRHTDERETEREVRVYPNVPPKRYFNAFDYYGGYGQRPNGSATSSSVYRSDARASMYRDAVHLQALVDYDPSSQGAAGDEKAEDERSGDEERGSESTDNNSS